MMKSTHLFQRYISSILSPNSILVSDFISKMLKATFSTLYYLIALNYFGYALDTNTLDNARSDISTFFKSGSGNVPRAVRLSK